MTVRGFPWHVPIAPRTQAARGKLNVSVVHRMIWQGEHKHQGVGLHQHVSAYEESLAGHDVAIFGDNHRGFEARSGNCLVYNSGNLMVRSRSDGPGSYGVLYADGSVERCWISSDQDIVDRGEAVSSLKTNEEIEAFVGELRHLSAEKIDFLGAVNDYLGTAKEPVRELLGRILDEHC